MLQQPELARRWLSFVLSRHETNDEILATLKALVPKREYGAVVEDLLWRAALRIDEPSFERVAATIPRGGALDSRVSRLRPLAQGKAGEMIGRLRDDTLEEPFQVLRFVRLLLEHLEAEEADVRRASVPLLRQVLEVLDTVGAAGTGRNAQVRVADELSARVHSVLEGLGQPAQLTRRYSSSLVGAHRPSTEVSMACRNRSLSLHSQRCRSRTSCPAIR
ncbi:MAG: hypothetical protein HY901_06370 [Deltaproteobacteria bacterium]|nr:hypothetical protein [Deltaproteobacteria bacterium]